MKEQKEKLINIKKRIADAIVKLGITNKESELDILEAESQKVNFWEDQENAKLTMQKVNGLKQIIGPWRSLEKEATELLEMLNDENADEELVREITSHILEIEEKLSKKETETYLSGKYDQGNAVLSIFAGAGGVDAQDWAEMLLSMYLKYAERHNFEASILSISPGQEAGVKSVSVEISGAFAYGLLKSEGGVHRLVRISPYDSDKARHTSFALVEVVPEIENVDIDIPESEIKIETFRASGHGGQSVNTTDSAVRLTHLPTGTVVICQNERSQLQNKAKAMQVLRARVQALAEMERDEAIKIIRGENLSAEWGSQIRSYVIHPYQMVKDHRTNVETSNTDAVLSGDLDIFIEASLKSVHT
jgi:peptide chain release factor 2